jgi:NADH dehydrogenase
MSALGADVNGPSRYQRTKGAAETLVRESGLDWTLFRPSVIFGREDRFLNRFAWLLKFLPIVFLGRSRARFQPVFVEDVAAAMVASLGNRESFGKTYELAGPRVYTLRELVMLAGNLTGYRRPVIGLGETLSYLQALTLEFLPGQLLTRDNYHSMQVDNVSTASFPFGIQPRALEAEAPTWLAAASPRARYRAYRGHARRAT